MMRIFFIYSLHIYYERIFINAVIIIGLKIFINITVITGSTNQAVGAGPCFSVTAVILAIAFGV